MTDELSPEAKAMLDAGRVDDAPSAEDRDRVRQRVVATLGVGAFGTLGAASKASAAAAIGESATTAATNGGLFAGMATSTKLAIAVVGVAGVVGTGVVTMRGTPNDAPAPPAPMPPRAAVVAPAPAPAPMQAPVVAPAPVIEAPTPAMAESEPPSEAPAPVVAPRPAPSPRHASPRPKPARTRATTEAPAQAPVLTLTPAAEPTLQPELALIGAAQAALGRGDAAKALGYLDRHAARFAQGALTQERMAARAIALCRLDRRAEGRGELDRLSRVAPRSPLLARAREACSR